jgi:hypothetical protein
MSKNTIYAFIGKDFEERVLYQNNNCTTKDLTGYTSHIKVAKYYESTPIVTITGAVETPATAGIVKYTAESDDIKELGYGTFVYSRYLLEPPVGDPPTQKVHSVISGTFVVIPSIE